MVFNYSIIIPYRDRLSLFQKAIESIPDRKDIQLIIVDNAPQPLLQDQIPVKLLARVEYTKSSPVKGAGCARTSIPALTASRTRKKPGSLMPGVPASLTALFTYLQATILWVITE